MSCGLFTGGRFNLPFISLPLIKPGPCMASSIHMQSVTFACSQLDLLRPDWSKPLGPGTHICLQITAACGSSAVPWWSLDLASNLQQWSVRIIELICIHWLSFYLNSSVSDAPKTLNIPSWSCCHCLDLIWSSLTESNMCIGLISHYCMLDVQLRCRFWEIWSLVKQVWVIKKHAWCISVLVYPSSVNIIVCVKSKFTIRSVYFDSTHCYSLGEQWICAS